MTNVETITLEMARVLLKQAMETQGRDFVYNPGGEKRSFYVPATEDNLKNLGVIFDFALDDPRRKTACLIGVALDLHGETRHHNSQQSVFGLHASFPGMMTERAANYFTKAQRSQDGGSTWGEAYDAAEYSLNVNLNE